MNHHLLSTRKWQMTASPGALGWGWIAPKLSSFLFSYCLLFWKEWTGVSSSSHYRLSIFSWKADSNNKCHRHSHCESQWLCMDMRPTTSVIQGVDFPINYCFGSIISYLTKIRETGESQIANCYIQDFQKYHHMMHLKLSGNFIWKCWLKWAFFMIFSLFDCVSRKFPP